MLVEKKLTGEKLTIYVTGRVDTVTAPELEKVITESVQGVRTLILDFKKLEYISSAGLRVVLAAQKLMSKQGKLTLVNVSKDIKDIFDMTGFSEILDIE